MVRSRRPERRAARARERADDLTVRRYLTALRARQRSSPPRTAEAREQLDRVRDELRGAPPLEELLLMQQHRDLEAEIRSVEVPDDLEPLEAAFVEVAASFGEAKGITYETWRELGVDPDVLEAAGIPPSAS